MILKRKQHYSLIFPSDRTCLLPSGFQNEEIANDYVKQRYGGCNSLMSAKVTRERTRESERERETENKWPTQS